VTAYSTNPGELRGQIEQEGYAAWERLSGQQLSRRDDGSIAPQGHNDALDAFRHAYTSGRVVQLVPLLGGAVSQHFGDRNEIGPAHPNNPFERRMDLWNNEAGRRMGGAADSPEELARRAFEGTRNGGLVTGLGDARLRQLFPDDPRLGLPEGSRERELSSGEDVRRINRDVDRALDLRQSSTFPESHPDRAMFDRLRADLPAGVTDSKVAEAVVAARAQGIPDSRSIGQASVHSERLFVEGTTPGFRSVTDLSTPAPPMAASLERLDAADRRESYARTAQIAQSPEPAQSYGAR